MYAIYRGRLATITENMGAPEQYRTGDLLHDMDGAVLDEELWVSFADPDLIVDPTDDQVEAAEAGEPIPPDPDAIAEVRAMAETFIRTGEMPR